MVTAVNIDRVVDGRIIEHGGAANLLEPLLSIGAIQPVGGGESKPDDPHDSAVHSGRRE